MPKALKIKNKDGKKQVIEEAEKVLFEYESDIDFELTINKLQAQKTKKMQEFDQLITALQDAKNMSDDTPQ